MHTLIIIIQAYLLENGIPASGTAAGLQKSQRRTTATKSKTCPRRATSRALTGKLLYKRKILNGIRSRYKRVYLELVVNGKRLQAGNKRKHRNGD